MKVVVIFDRFGPYHVARLKAAAKYMDIIPLEIAGQTSEYQWDKIANDALKNRVTLFDNISSADISKKVLVKNLSNQLNRIEPDVVVINGWYDRAARIALLWCLRRRVPAVVMSESAEGDDKRVWWKEVVKKAIVKQFSAAIVGGIRHAEYLKKLGLAGNRIFTGYDVVENDHFESIADDVRAHRQVWLDKKELPQNYFLIVSRFIEKKNLFFVIRAYHTYYKKAGTDAWHLVILGDGPLKSQLNNLIAELNLVDAVHFHGFKQYNELPIYFGLAKVFIHASTVEQWGLVVNEAMAAGLPVIISERCGCVPELVHEGVNGYAINPYDENALANILYSTSNDTDRLNKMAIASKAIIAGFNSDKFGTGLLKAVQHSIKHTADKLNVYNFTFLKWILNK